MIKVKFCGLKREEDIRVVNKLLPEFVGFVFWDKSKRAVSREQAKHLKELLDPGIKAVGVFLDDTVENVAAVLNDSIVDIAQLHGHEDEEYIKNLRSLSNKPVIKAFNISDRNDCSGDGNLTCQFDAINSCSADFVLLDSKVAGSGNTFNWDILKNVKRPYFLAGGLNLNNIDDALKIKPYAVDVSSGIETDGVKDEHKMQEFICRVRGHI